MKDATAGILRDEEGLNRVQRPSIWVNATGVGHSVQPVFSDPHVAPSPFGIFARSSFRIISYLRKVK